MKLLKKITKDNEKTYVNLYLELDSGKKIPISIRQVKKGNDVLNKNDYSIACAVAEKID